MANPNPSPETRFTSSGNPKGKTAEQRQAEVKAAEIAANLRLAALIRMQERLDAGEIDPQELVTPDNLRLFKDSEDRAHGTPKTAVDHTSSDGSMTPGPTRIIIEAASDDSEDQAPG
jgi:hypothetical protein